MKIADFQPTELRTQLRRGLHLQTGSFSVLMQSSIPAISEGLELLYADYTLATNAFADFHIKLMPANGVRRWIRPQVNFFCDGYSPFKPLPYDQAFPMLEWGLNWCISSHAHSYLIVHAAVIERNGFAAIMPAPPGSGKSTLCAALIHRGWRLLSDELTLINVSDGKITPLPRPVSLKNQSIQVIKNYVPESIFSRPVHDTIKGTVAHIKPSQESILRDAEAVRAAWIVFPKYQAEATTTLENIPKARAFMRVADNSFNYGVLGAAGFQALSAVIDGADAYDFTYSSLDEAMQFFTSLALQKA